MRVTRRDRRAGGGRDRRRRRVRAAARARAAARRVLRRVRFDGPQGSGGLSVAGRDRRLRATTVDSTRTLAFDDEFSSDAALDTTKWNDGVLPFAGLSGSTHIAGAQSGSYIQAQNATLQGGALNLLTTNVPVTNPDVPTLGTIPYGEGYVDTFGKFSRTGGYFEICAKFPQGQGLWPGFSLAAASGSATPHVDVAQWFGSLEALQVGEPFATGTGAASMLEHTFRYSDDPATGWHDYALWWKTSSPDTLEYFVDGQMIFEMDGTTSNLIPNTPMYMVLNSGTYSQPSHGGPPDVTTVFPMPSRSRMRVCTRPRHRSRPTRLPERPHDAVALAADPLKSSPFTSHGV